MKSKLFLMFLAIALLAGVAQANMLKNPGFEEGSFQTQFSPDNWENYYTSYGQVHTWLSGAGAHSGSKYIKMYNWLIRATSYVTTAYFGQEVVGVKEGKDYTFSVWAKNGVEGKVNLAEIYIDWIDAAGVGDPNWSEISAGFVDIPVTDANWVEINFGAITAPKGATAAWVWLANPTANGTKAIFYDDVSMTGADPNITAGADMISWDGETLSLTGTTSLDGYSTITWSVEPAAVITGGDTLTPTVDVDCIIPSGPATIANHSFENGLDNWEIIGGDGHGTWSGYDEPNDVLTVFITPTDGLECAYVDGVTDGVGTLSQILTNNLVAANTTYTLSVDVVNDGYYEENVGYRVQLRAGESLLKQDNDGQALDDYGVWATSTVTYESGATPTELGEPLEIRLVAKAGTQEMNFDNVRLTADPPFPAYVPDVLTLKMKLDIDGKYDTMKIDTYPDPCAAWLAAGLREPTDLVGDECITNVADLAEMVKTWPDDNALTAPKAKQVVPGKEGGFSVNFYGYKDWFDFPEEYVTLEEDQFAGLGDWLTDGWENIRVPFNATAPTGPTQTITNSNGATATFSLIDARQGDDSLSYASARTVAVGDGNGDLMECVAYGSMLGSDRSLIFDMEVSEIPFAVYEVIIYLGKYPSDDWDGDGSCKITFNGVETDVIVGEVFDGTFTEITDSVTPGNYIVYKNVTGSSFTVQVWGIDSVGNSSIGPAGFQFRSTHEFKPSPANDSYVYPASASDLELSWVNLDPNIPEDPVYVDVWFGTEPNEADQTYDWDLIVDADVDGQDANSVTVDASTLGTYYWQINSYIYGIATGDLFEGPLFSFHVATDAPVSVNAGADVVTWSGQAVQLAGSVDDDAMSALTIGWSADPNDGVVFTPNDGGDGSTSSAEDPTVTITKVTDNPSVVTLTFSGQDAVSSDEDTMKIDLYDTACLAAIGEGEEYDSGDVDADCDTDLEDYAALAEEWLVYNELTTSVPKP